MNNLMRYTLALLLLMITTSSALADTPQRKPVYSVGVVPQFDVRRIHSIWRPILDVLEKATGARFVLRGSISIPAFEQEYMSGVYDFAYVNPFQALLASRDQGYIPLVRDHGQSLHGILVVPKESPITSVSQLEGRTVVFPAPNALGATMMIRAALRNEFNVSVKPKYVLSHGSVYLNVLLNKAAAGGGVQNTLEQQDPAVHDGLRILYRTREVAPHPFVVHPRVPPAMQDKVRETLLLMAGSVEGSKMLSRIPVSRIGPAVLDDYRPLEEMGLDRVYLGGQ